MLGGNRKRGALKLSVASVLPLRSSTSSRVSPERHGRRLGEVASSGDNNFNALPLNGAWVACALFFVKAGHLGLSVKTGSCPLCSSSGSRHAYPASPWGHVARRSRHAVAGCEDEAIWALEGCRGLVDGRVLSGMTSRERGRTATTTAFNSPPPSAQRCRSRYRRLARRRPLRDRLSYKLRGRWEGAPRNTSTGKPWFKYVWSCWCQACVDNLGDAEARQEELINALV